MKRTRLISATAAMMLAGMLATPILPAAAASPPAGNIISGVTVVDANLWPSATPDASITHLVDGSGLSEPNFNGLHAPATSANAYRDCCRGDGPTGNGAGTRDLIFSLNGTYMLSSAAVWQFNSADPAINAGIGTIIFKTSMDGINFETISSSRMDLAPGAVGEFGVAQTVSFSAPARIVLANIKLTYGEYWGLSEVMFTGTAMPVPEPASYGLMGGGLLGLAAWRRRAQSRTSTSN